MKSRKKQKEKQMADIEFKNGEYDENPVLQKVVEPENDLKEMLVNYVGQKQDPEDDNVTVEMIVETLAEEFPEFVLVLAEENWVRGYNQALADLPYVSPQGTKEKNEV